MNEAKHPGAANGAGAANLPIGPATAIQENGEPGGGPSYWHSRGYLPHFESAEKIQHVTFHLADSLPKAALERMEAELRQRPPEQQDGERRQRLEVLRDAGYGGCVLRDPAIAQMVQNALLFFDGQRYRLLAWVIMPNHVHVLFQPLNGWTVAKIVASWKKFTARKICDYQKANPGSASLLTGRPRFGKPNPVWQREYWDRFIRNEKHLHQAISYIHQNPVKAGLVAAAEGWQWSSAYPGPGNGNANRLIGDVIGDEENAQNANQEIGGPSRGKL